jgi:hypothetical protein
LWRSNGLWGGLAWWLGSLTSGLGWCEKTLPANHIGNTATKTRRHAKCRCISDMSGSSQSVCGDILPPVPLTSTHTFTESVNRRAICCRLIGSRQAANGWRKNQWLLQGCPHHAATLWRSDISRLVPESWLLTLCCCRCG